MYVNPDVMEMSQILTKEEMGELVEVDAVKLESDKKEYLEKMREQLKTLGYKEVEVD